MQNDNIQTNHTTIKYAIVIPNKYIFAHPIPLVTILSYFVYGFLLIKFAIKEKVFPLFIVKNKKQLHIQGPIPEEDFYVYFAKDNENFQYSENSDPIPIDTKVTFLTGKDAIQTLKDLVLRGYIDKEIFQKIVLTYKYFYIRKEETRYNKEPKEKIIVAISYHELAKKAKNMVEAFFRREKGEFEAQ